MKKSSLKFLTFALALSLAITLLALPSCRSLNPSLYTIHRDSVAYTIHQTIDTLLIRDSVYRHDSVIYRERTIHDTVYITKEVYRDRLEARGERQKAVKTDTVVVTDSIVQVIEQPPERYIPKFYKHCTIYFWCAIVLLLLYIVFRITKAKGDFIAA